MTFAALTNWQYDKSLYHRIQSGPQHTGSNLNLIDTYLLTSSGYVWKEGEQQTFVALSDQGISFGTVTPGPPNSSGFFTDAWRAVPAAVSGYWTNYTNVYPHSSGALDVYNGFRRQGLFQTANSTVQTAFGPEPGLKDIGPYISYGNNPPDNQFYSPFETPEGNTSTQGITGGPVSYPLSQFPLLTNPTQGTTGSRADWVYNTPVYCQTWTEAVRSQVPPGETADGTNTIVRSTYRGRSSRYVPNYGGIYGVLGEGVRGMIRTFSSTVNSSNQKGI